MNTKIQKIMIAMGFLFAAIPAIAFAQDCRRTGCSVAGEICDKVQGAWNCVNIKGTYGMENAGFRQVGINKSSNLKGSIANIINIILGFLGIAAVIIILVGGFKWMTAAGNDEQVGEAKKMITQGIIGLVIIFSAWAIASFVITQMGTVVSPAASTAASTATPTASSTPAEIP